MSASKCEKCGGPNNSSISDPWCYSCCQKSWASKDSPNETVPEKKMRSDLERIKRLIDSYEEHNNGAWDEDEEIHVMRELLTSWQGITAADYQTDNRLHLNMLTKRMLND